jgi:Cu2+-containing amine oxidase
MIFILYSMIQGIVSSGAVMVQGVDEVTKVFVNPWTAGVVDFRKRYVRFIHNSYHNQWLVYCCYVC